MKEKKNNVFTRTSVPLCKSTQLLYNYEQCNAVFYCKFKKITKQFKHNVKFYTYYLNPMFNRIM